MLIASESAKHIRCPAAESSSICETFRITLFADSVSSLVNKRSSFELTSSTSALIDFKAAWADGARFDGWSEYFSFDRWECAAATALTGEPVDLDWYTTREREYSEVLPWDHLDAGLDRDWLWQDWQDAVDPAGAAEVEDCRWTPCYDCGVCPAMGTEIQAGPTGAKLLPLTVVTAGAGGGTGAGAGGG